MKKTDKLPYNVGPTLCSMTECHKVKYLIDS